MYHELNRPQMSPVRLPTEAELLDVLRETHPEMTIAGLVADLKAKKWATPRHLAKHFGFEHYTGPSFCNALLKFLMWRDAFGRRRLDARAWLRCFVPDEAPHGL